MKRHVAAMALVLAVGSLSACAEYTTTGVPEDSASAVAEQGADQQDALSGTSWALTDSSLEGGGLDQFEITAEFADESVAQHVLAEAVSRGAVHSFGPIVRPLSDYYREVTR